MNSAQRLRWAAFTVGTLLLPLTTCDVTAAAGLPESPALFGVGAQPCTAFIDVFGETTGREIALSGAMFSWAQGWFSARNLVGHESKPLVVGGTLSSDALKSQLVDECKGHPHEAIFLAVNDLYERLAKKGL